MKISMGYLTAVLALGLAGSAIAQEHHHGHRHEPAMKTETPATKAFRDANARMHGEMDIAYTGDIDRDFVAGMIPHHRGAVAMAKIALAHSKDPEIRRLAEEIVKAQDEEIAQMETILKRKDPTGR